MDASAFQTQACGDGDAPLTLSELVAFIDEDLRFPVAGAVAIVRHLLRLALMILTLAACVVLYIFALAWLFLFSVQTRLFTFTSVLLRKCMHDPQTVTASKNVRRRQNEPQTATSSSKSRHDRTTAYSGLSAEGHKLVAGQEEVATSRTVTLENEPHKTVEIDEAAIIREILQREEEIEAEIQQLTALSGNEDVYQSTSLSEEVPLSEDFSEEHVPSTQDENDDSTASDDENPAAEESSVNALHQADDPEQPNSGHILDSRPSQVADFKLATRTNTTKPRLTYAEQLKEKKLKSNKEQTAFVDGMKTNSILSRKNSAADRKFAEARRRQSRSNTKPVASPHRASGPVNAPRGPRSQVSRLSTGAGQTPVVPPHVRVAAEAKAKRLADEQLAHEALIHAKSDVPTTNFFAALTSEPASGESSPVSSRANVVASVEESKPVPCVKLPPTPHSAKLAKERIVYSPDALKAMKPPLSPSSKAKLLSLPPPGRVPVYSDELELMEVPPPAAIAEVKQSSRSPKRLVYTLEALKAINVRPTKETVEIKPSSPPPERSVYGMSTLKKSAPKPGELHRCAQCSRFTSEASICGPCMAIEGSIKATPTSPPRVSSSHDEHDENKTAILSEKVQIASPDQDQVQLEMQDLGKPVFYSKPRHSSGSSRTLPVTPGPLSFFAPTATGNTISTPQHEVNAYNAFVPGPFQSTSPLHQAIPFNHGQNSQEQLQQASQDAPPGYNHPHMSGSRKLRPQMPVQMPRLAPVAHSYFEPPAYGYEDPTSRSREYSQVMAVVPPAEEPRPFDLLSEDTFPALKPVRSVNLPRRTPVEYVNSEVPGYEEEDPIAPKHRHTLSFMVVPPEEEPRPFDLKSENTFPALGAVTPVQAKILKPPGLAVQPSDVQAQFDALVDIPSNQSEAGPILKAKKKEERKLARENLKEAWFEREESRKKLAGAFTLDGANDLKAKTKSYHEKRSVLQGLMASGVLNEQDGHMFQEFGLLDLAIPKVKVPGYEDWRLKRRAEQAEMVEAAPVVLHDGLDHTDCYKLTSCRHPQSQCSDFKLFDAMLIAERHRNQAYDQRRQPRPQSNVTHSTWMTKINQTCVRADKQYMRKRAALLAACPDGLVTELKMRFPEILG